MSKGCKSPSHSNSGEAIAKSLRRTNVKGVEGLHRFLDYAEYGTLIENAYAHVETVTDKIIMQQIAQRFPRGHRNAAINEDDIRVIIGKFDRL